MQEVKEGEALFHPKSQKQRQKDTQTELGCIKCSRCFIGVGFIYLTHMFY